MFYPGVFLTFEGVDGSGKTTQLSLLAQRLAAEGHSVVRAQEPGGTRVGNAIRRILLDAASTDLRAVPELLLYFASRAQNVEEVILPALAAGHIVLADRFTDASMAYQGYGRGAGGGARPHRLRGLVLELAFVIDIDIETSLERALGRNAGAAVNESRMEQETVEFSPARPGKIFGDRPPGAAACARDRWAAARRGDRRRNLGADGRVSDGEKTATNKIVSNARRAPNVF